MVPIILAFCLFVFVVKNLRFIIGCTIAILVAGFIMAPAHAENTDTFEYQVSAYHQFAMACQTTGNPQFCDARDGAYIRAMQLRPQPHYVTTPKSRYQQLDEQCRGGHGDDPQTRKACKKRDAMDKAGQ
jgi:hypothetical protein